MTRAWLVLVLAACGGGDRDPLEVETDSGGVRGVMQGDTRAFLGVPYAAPPVGELRWRPPQRAVAWEGVRDAVQTGLQCPQSFSLGGPGGDEDCLFVNVWSPPDGKQRPVLVWLHGGAFIFGSGGDSYYSGKHLAETYDVVVVTVNYRLGALGFLAHPALTAEDPGYPSSGNYGLDDQRAALEWVQRNIVAFGGDPGRVMLFGESAGGFSTCAHYVSPRSTGLFHAAISESGLCAGTVSEPTLAEAEAAGVRTAELLGCTGADAAACLRSKSSQALLDATAVAPPGEQPPGGPFYVGGENVLSTIPNVDGFVLRTTLREAFTAGDFEPRPLIIGSNRDEGTLFHSSFFAMEVATDAHYRDALGRRFGTANVDAIVARYPIAAYPSANRALAEVTGDAFFVCPTRHAARGAARAGADVYLYSFDHPLDQPFLADLGAFHSSEIPFVFGTDPAFPLGRVGEAGQPLASAMQRAWTDFAATAEPGAGWPRYDLATEQHRILDVTLATGTAHKAAACDFWDALVIP
ncbi:MAG: carboxylesterase family protein [Deltaproteobacteria bacterium]|nr:carboxylesterase family protein [Deltaproteobacteria bacterium]MDQ3297985.1 carboxylesterase family protein [Myxococcota bacterium]